MRMFMMYIVLVRTRMLGGVGGQDSPCNTRLCVTKVVSPDPISLCIYYISSHREKPYCRIPDMYSGHLRQVPIFSSEFSSIRDRSQNDFLANGHGEIIDVLTRKIIALVTTCVSFFVGACPDRTLLTMNEKII